MNRNVGIKCNAIVASELDNNIKILSTAKSVFIRNARDIAPAEIVPESRELEGWNEQI
ncbi:MAG: hypothetical protein PHP54_00525 [Clostridia bacterium]|nr:hypothetical protein [Clostridia bacterium]